MTHDEAVENAVAEADNADPVVDPPEPPSEDEEGEPPLDDPPPEEDPPSNLESPDLPAEDEILSLPHLPDPKYDDDTGDVLWFPRIIGGSRAQLGEFPSKVSLQSRSGSHFCGGSLITYNHILSAAHCVVTEEGRLLNPASVSLVCHLSSYQSEFL